MKTYLYKTYILPRVEHANNVWSSYFKKDVDLVENVQRKYTKFFPGLYDVTYADRLATLNLQTLEERRIYADLILLYKIIHGLVDIELDKYLKFGPSRTRGHPLKLQVMSSRVNCHKHHFFNRVVNIWNSLPSDVV